MSSLCVACGHNRKSGTTQWAGLLVRRAHVGKLPLKLVRSPEIIGIKESKVVASRLVNARIARGAGSHDVLDAEDIEVSGRGTQLEPNRWSMFDPSSTTIISRSRRVLLRHRVKSSNQQIRAIVNRNDDADVGAHRDTLEMAAYLLDLRIIGVRKVPNGLPDMLRHYRDL